MRYVLAVCAVAAALMFIAASAAMNWVFLSSLGKSHLEGQIFGGVSVAFDVMKSLLPLFIGWALAHKRVYAFIASGVFLLLFAFSVVSAIGFAASNRGAVVGGKDVVAARFKAATHDVADVEGRIAKLASARPEAVIVQALRATEQDRRFASSRSCTEATASDSRSFCETYFTTKAELAAASEGARLAKRLTELREEVARLQDAGAGQETDAQATLLARLSGFAVSTTQLGLVIFLAVLVEICAAMGLYLALGWMPPRISLPRASRDVTTPAPANVHRMAVVTDIEAVEAAPLRRLRIGSSS